jgi:hypothetical protein
MINLKNVSACLITKDPIYPKVILDQLLQFPFGEILILTNSDSPNRKHDLFKKATYDYIYYQDDDAICPIGDVAKSAETDVITVAMKPSHFEAHKDNRATMGLGWGSIFPKKLLESLKKYTDKYGEDEVYDRETERIFTYLNFPQNRIVLPIIDLPSAYAPDRLWRQPHHVPFKELAESRCATLL